MNSEVSIDRFEACLLGLALGDAFGAPFEGGPLERLLWRMVGKTDAGKMRWTDDTAMSLDLAESLIAQGSVDADDLARRFAASYRWSRGYGPGTAKVLRRVARGADWRAANRSVYPSGSYGNGGAMRSPVIGLYWWGRPAELIDAARTAAGVTHSHPLGLEGAVLIAVATAAAASGRPARAVLSAAAAVADSSDYRDRLQLAQSWLDDDDDAPPKRVRAQLGNGMAATNSCVSAIYVATRFMGRDFKQMLSYTIACGGDVDTIAAMAGAIWGAARGLEALPSELLDSLEQRERIQLVARDLHERCSRGPT